MRPILYDADRTNFPAGADNGMGILADALSCKVTQELNGQYELELHYPVAGIHYSEIALRSILRATVGPGGGLQPFRVYRIVPGMSGTAAVYARHIAYDLGGYVVSPFTAADAPSAVAAIKSHALPTDFPFALTTDKTTVATMSATVPTSAWSLLGGQQGSLLDVYGGEYEFDGWAVQLLTRRGADRGVSVRYGKNLTDLTQDANCASCYTGVVPYWRSNDVTVTAAPVYAEGDFGYTRLMPLDLSSSFKQQPTQAQLQAEAAACIERNQLGVPADALAETVEGYNACVKAGVDTQIAPGKELLGTELSDPAYYASKRIPTIHYTMGGLCITTDAQVCTEAGEPIPNLFACGEVTGGVQGGNRLGGNSFTDLIVFGRIAGASAVANA